MKLFQIIAIVLCLGFFLVPKDNFYAQNMQENCCKSDSGTSCCEKDHKAPSETSHDSKSKTSSCNDDCCSFCISCFTFIETPFSKGVKLEMIYYKANKNLHFQYSDPHISDRLKEIWQPPKLG